MADLSGRTIRVVAPARWVEDEILQRFSALATAAGAKVEIAPQCALRDHQLAGPDDARAAALNEALADDSVDIIWSARGGYGAPRLLDKINLGAARRGKVLVGYSDITALHLQALGTNVTPVHAAMPIDLRRETGAENLDRALHLCSEILGSGAAPRTFDLSSVRAGEGRGALIAGNLHVLATMLGTRFEPDWPDCILCVEDIGEYYYAIDRLFWRLSQSRLAPRVRGVALGDFTDSEDNEIAWGASVEQIAHMHLRDVPIATGMPIGHDAHNKPLVIGAACTLNVDQTRATLTV